ncbi:vacuolar protein sorting-associated protein 53 homolog isoform X2 [Coccinella septempunctata]|uniref:vacuolar protein sorting-associated protein 53 homolog isoform X2 n=1 Tax=Coccinella septempunctata TaxID=41139 RepID=UPI001D05E2F6|nr:vacuolar protein sorting-associated protein 53 homolog isoform X2 [Coccinella septempunctata]
MDLSDSELTESTDDQDFFINFDPEVQSAIEEVLQKKDPLDEKDFNTIDYINNLFPTEQSLSNIDEVVMKFENKIVTIDNEITTIIHGQVEASQEGKEALGEAQSVIKELFFHIKDIKEQAVKSEEMVREITRDIKQLDCAKRNLTLAITTLNHLQILVEGVDNLKVLTQKKLYGEIASPLQGISEVMAHFENYSDIPQIKSLGDQVRQIHSELAEQINLDFREAFSNARSTIPNKQLSQACLVASVLDSSVKKDLLKWFVDLQLEEYNHLFQETEDTAWLDKIDKRYAWLKKNLVDFEDKLGNMFPPNWEVSERIAVQFAHRTREQLSKIMAKRKGEMDVKLLLYAIQKTTAFENLLSRKFTGITITEENPQLVVDNIDNPEFLSVFDGLIGKCFVPHLEIYIDSVDKNLCELLERFIIDEKQSKPTEATETQASILPSCPDLFVFYKKSLIQCAQLDKGKTMLGLTNVFRKYLELYAEKLLQNNLPKMEPQSLGTSVSMLTRDIQKMSTSGLIQNFSSLLKEGDAVKLSREEQGRICCILTTAEYCVETTQQLSDKLKQKIEPSLADQVDFTKEQDNFHKVISNCIQILVQDLENACEPALTAMSKIQWQSIDAVGDQSPYISSICNHLKNNVPTVRDNLSQSRKYFVQFCLRFVNQFIPKFVQTVYKCKPMNTEGAEQLLLDAHMLKTALLNLPSVGSQVGRPPPVAYTKVVTKGMTKAEMILKVVMTPIEPNKNFVEQCRKLLPDCQLSEYYKILDMKSVKRQEHAVLVELFKSK